MQTQNITIQIMRQHAAPNFVAPKPISPYQLGAADASEGMDCNPSAYYHHRRQDHRRQYVAGFASVNPAKAFATMRGTDADLSWITFWPDVEGVKESDFDWPQQ